MLVAASEYERLTLAAASSSPMEHLLLMLSQGDLRPEC
jgi:hypothetical protein